MLLAIDPRGRGVLSKETLTRRGEDILPALHFTFRLILSQGGWSQEQGRSPCTNINTPQYIHRMSLCLVTDTATCRYTHMLTPKVHMCTVQEATSFLVYSPLVAAGH